jgi:hypothetical protein
MESIVQNNLLYEIDTTVTDANYALRRLELESILEKLDANKYQ